MEAEPPKQPPDVVEDMLDGDFEDHVDTHQHRREVIAGIADCDKEIHDYTVLKIGLEKELAEIDASLVESDTLYNASASSTRKRIFRNGVAFRMVKTTTRKTKTKHPGSGIFKVIG
jgi:hypothetical protein